MAPAHKTAPSLNPPKVEGRTCLQRAFGNWRTAENVARSLGYEVTYPGTGGHHWAYVPHEAVGEINATLARWRAETHALHTVTADHVSCRILDLFLRFSSEHFAQQLGIPIHRGWRDEAFIRIEDIGLVISAARAADQGPRWQTGPDQPARMIDLIETRGLRGIGIIDARREKRIPSGF